MKQFRLITIALLAVGFIALAGTTSPVHAQAVTHSASTTILAAQVLQRDGTLNLQRGFNGALDLAGWHVALDPQRGPVFAPAAPTDDEWSGLANGVSHQAGYDRTGASAIAVSGGDVYVAGPFTQICGDPTCTSGNITVNHIAKWDGANWSALGHGVSTGFYSYGITALAVNGSDVYAAGDFSDACGNDACDSGNTKMNFVGKWNGTNWSPLGHGVSDLARAIAVDGSDMYVGGAFAAACGNDACDSGNVTMNRIAKWDGNNWSRLDFGVHTDVHAIAISGTDVYVGGSFDYVCTEITCGTVPPLSNKIARYSTTGNSWTPLDNGVNATVLAIAVNGSDVYVGGVFVGLCATNDCNTLGTQVNHIAHWNGSTWSALDNGVHANVNALTLDGSNLYVGGDFTETCGNETCDNGNTLMRYVTRWDGSGFSEVGSGVDDRVIALADDGTNTYAGGNFTQTCGNATCDSGNLKVNHIAMYGPAATCVTKPAKPTLRVPANNTAENKLRVKLKWHSAICADTYNVVVKDAATGHKADIKKGLTKLKYKTKALGSGETYKWFVQACNANGCRKSAARTFKVN